MIDSRGLLFSAHMYLTISAGEACETVVSAEPVSQQRHVCRLCDAALLPLYLFADAPPAATSRRPLRAAVTVRVDAMSRPVDVCGR